MDAEERALERLIEEVLCERDSRVQSKVTVHESVAGGILEEAEGGDYDLLVIGASNEWGVKSLLAGAIPDAIADQAPCSVLMVRRCETTGISTFRRVVHSIRGW